MRIIDSPKLKTVLKVLCECGCGNSLTIQKGADFWVFEFDDGYEYNFIDKIKMKFKYVPPDVIVDHNQISEMLIYLQHYVNSVEKISWPENNRVDIDANSGKLELHKMPGTVIMVPAITTKINLFKHFKNKVELILEQDEFEKFVLLLRSAV